MTDLTQLHMPRRQRFAVAMLFGMGIIVTIAGIVRTFYIYKSLISEYDQTWYAYPLWIAAAVEIDLGVVCPSFKFSCGSTDTPFRSARRHPYFVPSLQAYPSVFQRPSRAVLRTKSRQATLQVEQPPKHHGPHQTSAQPLLRSGNQTQS